MQHAESTAAPAQRVLPFGIVYCSSQDDAFPAAELLREEDEPGTLRGWQTAKSCKYPQMVILRFPCDVELWQLQILSHECKIASKVEVRVYALQSAEEPLNVKAPPTFKEVKYTKLGSVGFNNNEKSKFRSKERKTVHLKAVAYFLKLMFHKPHPNPLNTAQQIGIYSVVCYGQLLGYPLPRHMDVAFATPVPGQGGGESPMSESGLPPILQHTLKQLSHKSPARHNAPPPPPSAQRPIAQSPSPGDNQHGHGAYPSSRLPPIKGGGGYGGPAAAAASTAAAAPPRGPNPYDTPQPRAPDQPGTFRSSRILEFETFYVRRTHELAAAKAHAIDVENFLLAKEVKDTLVQLQAFADQIYNLEGHKVRAIYAEDFDEAKRMKRQMDDAVEQASDLCGGGGGSGGGGEPTGLHGGRQGANGKRLLSDDRTVVEMPPIDPARVNGSGKHAFEEVPVTSKYAAMMAARAQEQGPEGDDPHDDGGNDDDDRRRGANSGDDDSGSEAPVSRRASSTVPSQASAPRAAAAASSAAYDDGDGAPGGEPMLTADGAFNVGLMPKWEQEVYTAVHSCTDELPAEAQDAMETSELQGVLGRYAACCLLSKRWKLREAAIRAITDHMNTLFPNASPAAVVTSMCRFFDYRNSGLQDSIANVVVASCAFLQMVLKGGVADCTTVQFLPILGTLLPRLIFRATDAMAKVRDPVIGTVLAFAECHEFGVERVLAHITADPVDQDKRRIPNQNSRIQMARLQITQQLLDTHKNYNFPGNSTFDHFMNKLMLPCVNHQNNEVRDLSVKIFAVVEALGQDIGKYVGQVQNPAVVSTLLRLSGSVPDTEERPKKRNTSAPKRSGKRSVEPH